MNLITKCTDCGGEIVTGLDGRDGSNPKDTCVCVLALMPEVVKCLDMRFGSNFPGVATPSSTPASP